MNKKEEIVLEVVFKIWILALRSKWDSKLRNSKTIYEKNMTLPHPHVDSLVMCCLYRPSKFVSNAARRPPKLIQTCVTYHRTSESNLLFQLKFIFPCLITEHLYPIYTMVHTI